MNINGIGLLISSMLCGYGIYSQTDKLLNKIFEFTILKGNATLRTDMTIFRPLSITTTILVCTKTLRSPKIQLGILIILFISNSIFDSIQEKNKPKPILDEIKSDLTSNLTQL